MKSITSRISALLAAATFVALWACSRQSDVAAESPLSPTSRAEALQAAGQASGEAAPAAAPARMPPPSRHPLEAAAEARAAPKAKSEAPGASGAPVAVPAAAPLEPAVLDGPASATASEPSTQADPAARPVPAPAPAPIEVAPSTPATSDPLKGTFGATQAGGGGGVGAGLAKVELGRNPLPNKAVVERFDDDQSTYSPSSGAGAGSGEHQGEARRVPTFYRGQAVASKEAPSETVRYVFVSRGAWLVRALQPFLDQVGQEMLKEDNADLTADVIELNRTFAYLCLLIASDDGSDGMLKAIARAVAIHREGISNIKLHWGRKSDRVARLLDAYVSATFLKNIDIEKMRVRAGSLSASKYQGPAAQTADLQGAGEPKKGAFSIDLPGLAK